MSQYSFLSLKLRRNALLTLIACALAFAVILLGAYTRLTDAGLSCPDWPNCYGFATAPHTTAQLQAAAAAYPDKPVDIKKAWTEMTHRYFAGSEGILIIIIAVSIIISRRRQAYKPLIIAAALFALLATQVLLGMLTVTVNLKPAIVTAHLVTGISILSVLWWTYLDLPLKQTAPLRHNHAQLKPWLWLGLAVIAGQIFLGGWISTHYAGLVCIDLPYCNGKLIPALHLDQFNTDLLTIHMMHRIGAAITAIYIGLLGLFLLNKPSLKNYAKALLCLLALQITLGIFNILWLRPVWLALTHHAVGVLLLLTMIATLVKAHYEARDKNYGPRIS